jgi:hypothetical protein
LPNPELPGLAAISRNPAPLLQIQPVNQGLLSLSLGAASPADQHQGGSPIQVNHPTAPPSGMSTPLTGKKKRWATAPPWVQCLELFMVYRFAPRKSGKL